MGWTEEEEEEEDITYWIKPGVASQGDGKKREGQERVERELGRAKERKKKRGREEEKERDGCLVSVSGKVVPVYSSEYDIAVSTEYRDREGIYNRVWYECTEYGICH